MRTISFEVSITVSGTDLHFSLHSKGTVNKQIARFVRNFARNFMICGEMINKRIK